jgi:hypothetical protein
VGDKPFSGWALQCLGEVARRQGLVTEARDQFVESLLILRDIGHRRHSAQVLSALGALAVQQEDYTLGVQFISAAEATHEQVRISLDADENIVWDDTLATAHAELGEADFAAAWADGQSLTLEQAINFALTISE